MQDLTFFKMVFFAAVTAVFIGDVHLPQTVPLSMLITSLFVLRMPRLSVAPQVLLLVMVFLSGMVNIILAGYYDAQRDFVIYLPVVYALLVQMVAGGVEYDDRWTYALGAGAVILCCLVYWAFLVSPVEPTAYYQLKLTAETPLGRSNYLAAFLGFVLVASTFWSPWLSLIVLPAFVLTLSRTGILLVMAFLLFRFVRVRRYSLWVVLAVLALVSLGYHFANRIYDLPEIVQQGLLSAESFDIRIRAWVATIDIIQNNLLFGVPRGYYRDALERAVPGENLWDPHNSILHMLVSFGIVGSLFYLSYVITIVFEIYRASMSNWFWRGVCWGYSLILVWSLLEPLLLTPAIEILQAYLFIMARQFNLRGRIRGIGDQLGTRDFGPETR